MSLESELVQLRLQELQRLTAENQRLRAWQAEAVEALKLAERYHAVLCREYGKDEVDWGRCECQASDAHDALLNVEVKP